jgi:hypothetical protein
VTFPRPRRKRPRFNGSPSDHAVTEQWPARLRTDDVDGATYNWTGASDIGVMAIATFTHAGPAPLDGYQPAPAAFPALPAAPGPERRPVLPPVPVAERAVIGDDLRLPVIWCEMPGCISWGYDDTVSAGFADSRRSAIGAGWRYDALGRLACTTCQQTRPDYDNPQPVAWHHPEVRRRWHAREHITEQDAFRLGVEAEVGRRISRESPALARSIAGATARTAGAS